MVRNPVDAVSLSRHLAVSQDAAIDFMADEQAILSRDVRSLPDQLPLQLLRYEDLKSQPLATLRAAAEFLGLASDAKVLQAALAATAFDKLRAQEARAGFRELDRRAEVFFRRGEVGTWREELSESRARRLIVDHGPMMQALGYLDAGGHSLC